MTADNDQLRTKLERKFQPPVDVLMDPSLLVSSRSLERLTDSAIFSSQTQATLGRNPTQPRLGDLCVPATFYELVASKEQLAIQKTDVWDFYRGQAEAAFPDDVVELLDENNVNGVSREMPSADLRWTNSLNDPNRRERLVAILKEELSFLWSGGVVLSRTPVAFKAFRNAGVPTIDIGNATLEPELHETLTDIGYSNPAGICAFGVSTAESSTNALVGNVLENHADFLLYRLGD